MRYAQKHQEKEEEEEEEKEEEEEEHGRNVEGAAAEEESADSTGSVRTDSIQLFGQHSPSPSYRRVCVQWTDDRSTGERCVLVYR